MRYSKSGSKRKIIAIQAHVNEKQGSQGGYLLLQLNQLEKEHQKDTKINSRWSIVKSRAEINEIKTIKTIQKINETKSWFFKRVKR